MTPITGSFILGAVAMAIVLNGEPVMRTLESGMDYLITTERLPLTVALIVVVVIATVTVGTLDDQNTDLRARLATVTEHADRLTKQCEPLP